MTAASGASMFLHCLGLLLLIFAAGRAGVELFVRAAHADRAHPVLRNLNYLAIGLGPTLVLIATWFLKLLNVYSFLAIVGALVAIVVAALAFAPRFRAFARKPWVEAGPLFYGYLAAVVLFWLLVAVENYTLRKDTSLYLLQGFNLFFDRYAAHVPHFGESLVAPVFYTGHLISSVFALFSYGDHFGYYAFGSYWVNVLLAPAVPLGAYLLFRRFAIAPLAIAFAWAFCSIVLGPKVWSLRGESLGWLIGFAFLIATVDVVRALDNPRRRVPALRLFAVPTLLFFGVDLTHGVAASVSALFVLAFALCFALAGRLRPETLRSLATAVGLGVALLVALLGGFIYTYSGTASVVESGPRPTAGELDGAMQFDNASRGVPIDRDVPRVHAEPPYVAAADMLSLAAILPVAALARPGFDLIPIQGFPSTGLKKLATISDGEKALYIVLVLGAIALYASRFGRTTPPRHRALFAIALTIYVALIALALYLDDRSVSLYPVTGMRRTFVYGTFFYWLAVAVAAADFILAPLVAHYRAALFTTYPEARSLRLPSRKRLAAVAIAAFLPLWFWGSISARLANAFDVRWTIGRLADRAASFLPGHPLPAEFGPLPSTIAAIAGAMEFVEAHTAPRERVYSNVISSEDPFWFLTSGRYSLLEGTNIYQLFSVQKAAAHRIVRFAVFARVAEPRLLAPYRVRYAVIYTGSKCWHADCYGDYRFPTDGALFAKTFPVVYRNTGYSVYELAGHAPALSREFVQRVFRVCTEPGDSDIAIMECSRVLAAHGALSSSQVPDALIARADAYVEQGDIRRAAADYREAARLRPRDPRALEGAGRQALAAGDWAAAVRWFARALAIRPGDPDLHYLRGSALLQGARYHEAIREFDRTVALMPDYGMAYYERAQAEKAIDLAPAALADLRRTLEVNPNITAARADLRALLSEAR